MTEPLRCANHPNVETMLRCNQCEKPICARCAVRTPTGYRCKECVRGQLKVFETAVWYDYPLGFVVAAILSLAASQLIGLISLFVWGLLVLAAAPFAGGLIATATQWTLRRHRSRALFLTCAAGVVVGALPAIVGQIVNIVFMFQYTGFSPFSLFPIFWQLYYVATAAPVVYARLSGIQMNR